MIFATVIAGITVGTNATAHAERDLCQRGAVYRGRTIDFDMKDADLHEVYRMLADVGKVNIVLADTVRGKVTMRLRRVPWDQVACTIASVHRLSITVDGNILLVTPREKSATATVAAPRSAHRADRR